MVEPPWKSQYQVMMITHKGSYDVDGRGGGDSHGGRAASTLAAAAAAAGAAGHGAGGDFHNSERLGGSRVEGGNFGAALAVDLGAGALSLRQSVSCTGSSLVRDTYGVGSVLVRDSALNSSGEHSGGGTRAHGVGHGHISGGNTAGLGGTRAGDDGCERDRNRSADDCGRGHHARRDRPGDHRGRVATGESAVVATGVEEVGVLAVVLGLADGSERGDQGHGVFVDELHVVDS